MYRRCVSLTSLGMEIVIFLFRGLPMLFLYIHNAVVHISNRMYGTSMLPTLTLLDLSDFQTAKQAASPVPCPSTFGCSG